MVVVLFAMMAGNAVAAAAAPLDLSNWMAALEPIVGNNTLLDLSVRDSADTGVCSIRKFLQRHIACRLCTLTKSTYSASGSDVRIRVVSVLVLR